MVRRNAGAEWLPDLERCWYPKYTRIDLVKEVDDAVKIALATVALPFGIVPPVRVNGVDYVTVE